MFSLRPYQEEARKKVHETFRKVKRCLAVLPTGSGKTAIAASLISDWQPLKCLFLADRDELISQPLQSINRQTGMVPDLEKGSNLASLDSRVVVGSIQSLCRDNHLSRFKRDHFHQIVCDEAHLSLSKSWRKVLNHFNEARVLGITATPFRSDFRELSELYEAEAYRVSLNEIVNQGWLVPLSVYHLETKIDLEGLEAKKTTHGKDLDENEIAHRIEPYLDKIASELATKGKGRKVLAFLPLIATSEKFASACQNAGLQALHVDGKDPDRAQKIKLFHEGKLDVLSNSSLLHTGLDFPICDATLNLRPTFSTVLYQQIVGRSTRVLPGILDGRYTPEDRKAAIASSAKPRSYIYDPLYQFKNHGLVTPECLFAQSLEEAEEMAHKRRARGEIIDLEKASLEFQREKEEDLVKRFLAVRDKDPQLFDALEYAARVHEPIIAGYEPIFSWEKRPITRFEGILLRKHGIDPSTVKSQGQFKQVMASIGRRIHFGLAPIKLTVIAQSLGIPNAEQMTVDEINQEIDSVFA